MRRVSDEIVSPTICVMPINCFSGTEIRRDGSENCRKADLSLSLPLSFAASISRRSSLAMLPPLIRRIGNFLYRGFLGAIAL